ncbi:hypothetical protein FOL47_009695 [Perkinsus chesapeaki]|uniref:Thymus-specific serine protease n=1 Tax=Perkinsus chesapeaki TaxID=330153 RepID=A0A7J6L6W1_PERCH|nr:hypothetical protein FOL47_009695 [Perkinsus chesapeaki]
MFKGFVLLVGFIDAAPLSWQPTVANCTERWLRQDRDHFSFSSDADPGGFDQRYFTYTEFYRPGGPVFFYVGNEGAVELYVNHTGLMWELGSELGAMLVFAEHRYYGKSSVYPTDTSDCMRYLSIAQALGDYSVLIDHIFIENSLPASTATIAFGGSYGGMLASAFRYKYPHLVDGAIASSAPIFAIGGITPEPSRSAFYEIITRDAGPVCAREFKETMKLLERLEQSEEEAQVFKEDLIPFWRSQGCPEARSPAMIATFAIKFAKFLSPSVWTNMAMGNYPYPSSYLISGPANLPANPIRTACAPFERARTDQDRLRALAESFNMYYNASGNIKCETPTKREFNLPSTCEGSWLFQQCTEMPWGFDMGTEHDMFLPPSEFDMDSFKAGCEEFYGVTTRERASLQFVRNMADAVASMSNVVFSNGKLDPWGGEI